MARYTFIPRTEQAREYKTGDIVDKTAFELLDSFNNTEFYRHSEDYRTILAVKHDDSDHISQVRIKSRNKKYRGKVMRKLGSLGFSVKKPNIAA